MKKASESSMPIDIDTLHVLRRSFDLRIVRFQVMKRSCEEKLEFICVSERFQRGRRTKFGWPELDDCFAHGQLLDIREVNLHVIEGCLRGSVHFEGNELQ